MSEDVKRFKSVSFEGYTTWGRTKACFFGLCYLNVFREVCDVDGRAYWERMPENDAVIAAAVLILDPRTTRKDEL